MISGAFQAEGETVFRIFRTHGRPLRSRGRRIRTYRAKGLSHMRYSGCKGSTCSLLLYLHLFRYSHFALDRFTQPNRFKKPTRSVSLACPPRCIEWQRHPILVTAPSEEHSDTTHCIPISSPEPQEGRVKTGQHNTPFLCNRCLRSLASKRVRSFARKKRLDFEKVDAIEVMPVQNDKY